MVGRAVVSGPLVIQQLVTAVPTRPAALTANRATMALSGVLALAATTIAVRAGSAPILRLGVPAPVLHASFIGAFFLCEQLLLNVEFRRQAHSLTLAGVPLMLAVLAAPAHTLVLDRVLGALLALLLQRISADKIVYNLSAYAFELAAASAAARALIGPHQQLTFTIFLGVLGIVIAGDQLTSGLVLGVIRMHNGPLSAADAAGVLLPSLFLTVISGALAAVIVLLSDRAGWFGACLVLIISVLAALAYHGYAATNRRHQSLELVHDFVTDAVGAESVAALSGRLLSRMRDLMRAGTATLTLFDDDSGAMPGADTRAEGSALQLQVDDSGALRTARVAVDAGDWLLLRARTDGEPVLLARDGKDPATRRWLSGHGLRDAVLVPVPAPSGACAGIVLITDRLGDTTTFTGDDLTLLQTLTGHLAVALRSTRLVETLGYQASHDSLTALANRAHLADRIHAAGHRRAAVLLLDLDRFKEVNDSLGHDAGDRLLIATADRLRRAAPPEATIARLGGDEFALLLPDVAADPAAVLAFAHTLAGSLAQPVQLAEARVATAASIGVAISTPGADHHDLLRQADTAMYAAKTGTAAVSLYNADMDRQRQQRLALLADLRWSLAESPHEFAVHYQPKIDLDTGAVTSVEALIRWHHPTRGAIAPDQFIPLAEATGLIEQLTPLVLDTALADCAHWTRLGHAVTVAVNLSAQSIGNPELPALVHDALRRHHVEASQLILEITESSVMADPDQTLPVLHTLKDQGIALSLDDFGTGYSSLSYLQRLPVAELKIDQSFITGLTGPDPGPSRALIRGITSLGASLNLRIVAEGVEHEHTLAELRTLGCHLAQGYHISRPLPADQLHPWLQHHTTTHPRLRLISHTAAS